MSKRKRNIVFLHPDLGIGGAERLVVDAAVGLQKRGHKVTIFTSHCDPRHCFEEARDGTLDVRVRSTTLIPANLFGRLAILCAILRQIYLVLAISWSGELASLRPDVFFVDQLSACIPLLRLLQLPDARVLFYCHFPDKLLASRRGWLKKAYRLPFDWVEACTTGTADRLLVNSRFTRGVFGEAFPSLKYKQPGVVYPCVATDIKESGDGPQEEEAALWDGKKVVLSINRFERKKNVALAVRAFYGLSSEVRSGARLVIAGGYDIRVHENVSYHDELVRLAESLGLRTATAKTIVSALNVPSDIDVLFLLSVPSSFKTTLLRSARLLVYTPANEHFGIVPLEAMLAGVPVLAASSGGPLETVVPDQSGWLKDADDVQGWTGVMLHVLSVMGLEDRQRMKEFGQKRVRDEFSEAKMAERLEDEMSLMFQTPREGVLGGKTVLLLGMGGAVGICLVGWLLTRI
ncbi:MAG: hypothetical protein M1825_002459 [Sarcosagium campestre]|nr:MAG: hypothetical protein M1825_002459 [Sarcosagium campestre]